MTKMKAVLVGLVATAALLVASVPAPQAAEDGGTPWLGVYTQGLTDDLREGLYYNGSGVLVNRVVGDSPADRAGVRQGDVIVRVDGRDVSTPDGLAELIQSHRAGETITVRVVRDRTTKELKVTLAARDDAEDDDAERPGWRGADGRDFSFDFDGDTIEVPDLHKMVALGGRGRLGVRIESLNPQLGEYFQIHDGKGALVLEVVKDSPGERAGIEAGDVITRVGSGAVDDADDLIGALSREQGKVSLTVIRHGGTQTIEAELEDAPRAFTMRHLGPERDRIRRHIVLRDRDRSRADELRGELDAERGDLEEAVRELRRELREMKRELEELRNED